MNFARFVIPALTLCTLFLFVACDQPSNALTPQTPAESVAGSDPSGAGGQGDQADSAASDASEADVAIVEGDFNWPRLLGKTFDGVAEVDGITFDWTRRPSILWKLPVGEGYGLGSVYEGRYYHADAERDGSRRMERLRAIDLKSGQTVWSVNRPMEYRDMYGYESGPRGTPTTDGKSIITFGCDGGLYCRDLSDGSMKWSVDTNQRYGVVQNFFGVGSSPLILGSQVIVPVGGSPPEDQDIAPGRLDRVISNGSALVAFDLETGKEIWKCGEDLASYSSPRTMQIGSQTVVLLFARDHLLAVDPAKGEVLWKQNHRADMLESVNAMIPIVDGNRVFISECYQVGSMLLEVSADKSEILWKDPPKDRRSQAMRCHWSTPILVDGFLYGCSGRNNPDSDFRCVELATGKVRWNDDRQIRTCVARVGDHLLVLNEIGQVQIVRPSPDRLELVAEFDFSDQLRGPCWAAPIVVGNRVLIRGDRNVLCLAVPTN